jgi:hypothetical protein
MPLPSKAKAPAAAAAASTGPPRQRGIASFASCTGNPSAPNGAARSATWARRAAASGEESVAQATIRCRMPFGSAGTISMPSSTARLGGGAEPTVGGVRSELSR